jgi:hypothetical protein
MKTVLSLIAFTAILMVLGCETQPVPSNPPTPGSFAAAGITSREVVAAAEFAVDEHSKSSSDGVVKLVKVTAAEQQVVAGVNYKLTLQVRQNGMVKTAEAIVWWQSWNTAQPYRLTEWSWR